MKIDYKQFNQPFTHPFTISLLSQVFQLEITYADYWVNGADMFANQQPKRKPVFCFIPNLNIHFKNVNCSK